MMINKQQAVVDGSIEPGGHQSRLGMVTTIRSGEKDAQMFNSHIKLRERGNRLDMESMNNQFFCASGDGNSRDDNQSDGMNIDDSMHVQRGPAHPNSRSPHNDTTRATSYRDAFLNSEARWRNWFQEWGMKEL